MFLYVPSRVSLGFSRYVLSWTLVDSLRGLAIAVQDWLSQGKTGLVFRFLWVC